MHDCPCGSAKTFYHCCGPYLERSQIAASPEQLMRSRYSAYTLGGYGKYLLDTWLPSIAHGMKEADLDRNETQWRGLSILASAVNGDDGEVQFEARFMEHTTETLMFEKSVFKRLGKCWFYVGGDVSYSHVPEPKRNAPCTCGSGKKYKKCCLS